MQVWCWRDIFIYRQCCDTATYGPAGFEFCFAQPGLSFELCCPEPEDLENPLPNVRRQWVSGWFDDTEHHGCHSRFYWLPAALAFTLNFGPQYHHRTGEVMVDGRNNASVERSSVQGALKKFLEHKELGFRAFLRHVRAYIQRGEVGVELVHMINEVLTRFGESFTQCPQAALFSILLKIEAIFARDAPTARRFLPAARTIATRAVAYGRVPPVDEWGAGILLKRLDAMAQASLRPRIVTVDFVLPLCTLTDVEVAARSLEEAFRDIRELSSSDKLYAQMALQVYDICGVVKDSYSSNLDLLSDELLQFVPTRAHELFRNTSVPGRPARVSIRDFVEEVPAGDLTAYMNHLAEASATDTLADVTLLLHADFAEHIRAWVLEQILGAIIGGSWSEGHVDFMYLGWRHEGPNQDGGRRVATTVRWHCGTSGKKLTHCFGHPEQPLASGAKFGDFNPTLFENLWRWTFGCDFDAELDDFGGFDFSQLLVSKKAVLARPASFWRYLARKISDRSSFQLLPGTTFVSRRVDLSPSYRFNKGVSIWFEHLWHLLLDPLFFPEKPDAGSVVEGGPRDLRAFTRISDPRLPFGFRVGGVAAPDNVMLRHYWLNGEEQCFLFKDRQGCHLAKLSALDSKR